MTLKEDPEYQGQLAAIEQQRLALGFEMERFNADVADAPARLALAIEQHDLEAAQGLLNFLKSAPINWLVLGAHHMSLWSTEYVLRAEHNDLITTLGPDRRTILAAARNAHQEIEKLLTEGTADELGVRPSIEALFQTIERVEQQLAGIGV